MSSSFLHVQTRSALALQSIMPRSLVMTRLGFSTPAKQANSATHATHRHPRRHPRPPLRRPPHRHRRRAVPANLTRPASARRCRGTSGRFGVVTYASSARPRITAPTLSTAAPPELTTTVSTAASHTSRAAVRLARARCIPRAASSILPMVPPRPTAWPAPRPSCWTWRATASR